MNISRKNLRKTNKRSTCIVNCPDAELLESVSYWLTVLKVSEATSDMLVVKSALNQPESPKIRGQSVGIHPVCESVDALVALILALLDNSPSLS